MGGAAVVKILVGLIRMKVAAIVLGPAGIGTIGLFLSLMDTASTIAAFGVGMAGTRRIADVEVNGDPTDVERVRRALFIGSLGLAIVGAGTFFLLRNVLADWVFREKMYSKDIGWLSLGVFLSVASGSQQALLNGLRKIGDMAKIQIGSGLISALVGVAALLIWGDSGIVAFVIGAPLATFLLGHWYSAHLNSPSRKITSTREISIEFYLMVRLGSAFVISGLVLSLGYLAVRSIIQQNLGIESLGHVQAAWAISMTYISFVLAAMGSDFYPRLTAVIHDRVASTRLVNEQTEVALLLAGPVLIAMLATAPWVVTLLYTHEFAPATHVLRWQIIGDILKVASWPLGFVLLAAGSGKMFLATEIISIGTFVLCTAIGLPLIGISATGISFLILYSVYLPMVYWLARRSISMIWSVEVKRHFVLLLIVATVVMVLAQFSEIAATGFGVAAAVGLGLLSLGRLGSMARLLGPVGRIAAQCRKATKILKMSSD